MRHESAIAFFSPFTAEISQSQISIKFHFVKF